MRGIGFYNSEFFTIKKDRDLVAESITRLVMTNFRERIGHPFFGGNLKRALFELSDDTEITDMKNNLTTQIEQYEPRATVTKLNFAASAENENAVEISIGFLLIGDPVSDERILVLTIQS